MITQPHAVIKIYNYKDRAGGGGGPQGLKNLDSEIEAPPMVIYRDILSIVTTKYKSQPSGTFTINLAPTRNWITALSLGSWISIHISTSHFNRGEEYSSKNLKMIGRINGVRLVTETNQETGAVTNSFEVTGKDWGQIFESNLYVDQAILYGLDNVFAEAGKFSERFDLKRVYTEEIPSTTNVVDFLIQAWGKKNESLEDKTLEQFGLTTSQFFPTYTVELPKALVEKLNTKDSSFSKSNNLSDAIKIVTGKLVGADKYEESTESLSFIDFQQLIGNNAIWQLLEANCNNLVNELIADIKWTNSNDKPEFVLYKRIKPFFLNSSGMDGVSLARESKTEPNQYTEKIKSPFFYLKKTKIGKEHIIKIDCGVNWEDRINFIEILPNLSLYYPYLPKDQREALQAKSKAEMISVVFDKNAFVREGIRPMIVSSNNVPIGKDGKGDPCGFKGWMPIIREWYFNSHKMLNGGITIVGNTEYIGVGENIIIPASALGKFPMVEGQIKDIENASLLAHVEAISNIFSVGPDGNKSYYRNINFIRGVIVNNDGTALLNRNSFAVDTLATAIPEENEKATNVYRD